MSNKNKNLDNLSDADYEYLADLVERFPQLSWLSKNLYDPKYLAIAQSRGYDDEAHRAALVKDAYTNDARLDSDEVVLTHPFNWLTEEEADEAAKGPRKIGENHADGG